MTAQAIQAEFDHAVIVREVTEPMGAAPIGLVEMPDGTFCVIELDVSGFAPLMEDFSIDEADEALAHFNDRVKDLSSRKEWAGQAIVEEMIGRLWEVDVETRREQLAGAW
jgi:hypothetical protein